MSTLPRRRSIPVHIGAVVVGGGAPVAVQSMTNTDTADIERTAQQSADLARAGSELVRITVDREQAAKAVPHIRDRLLAMGVTVPLIGDFADWLPIPYHFVFERDGQILGVHKRRFGRFRDVYDIDMSADAARSLDRRLVLAAAVGMDALQAR